MAEGNASQAENEEEEEAMHALHSDLRRAGPQAPEEKRKSSSARAPANQLLGLTAFTHILFGARGTSNLQKVRTPAVECIWREKLFINNACCMSPQHEGDASVCDSLKAPQVSTLMRKLVAGWTIMDWRHLFT